MNKVYCGIDPGITGGIAFYGDGYLKVYDMPIEDNLNTAKSRKKVDVQATIEIFKNEMELNKLELALLEDVHSMPGDGHVGAFTFGRCFGAIEAILEMTETTYLKIAPAVWKMQMNLGKVKKHSLEEAIKVFAHIPNSAKLFSRLRDHNLAEAALLAYHAKTKFGDIT